MGMDSKTICKIVATATISLPLASTMFGYEMGKGPEGTGRGNRYSGLFMGVVTGIGIQALTLATVCIVKGQKVESYQTKTKDYSIEVAHTNVLREPAANETERALFVLTNYGIVRKAMSHNRVPQTTVVYRTTIGDEKIRIQESRPGFIEPTLVNFNEPVLTHYGNNKRTILDDLLLVSNANKNLANAKYASIK